MKTSVYLYPWHEKSRASRDLSQALEIKRILREGSKFVGNKDKTVINYGNSSLPENVLLCNVLNKPTPVGVCTNKLSFFRNAKGFRVPPWTDDQRVAMSWVQDGVLVAARTKLQAHSGAGIVFSDNLDDFVKAALYTKYIRKKEEYRVHFAFGNVIAIQRKVLRQKDDAGNDIDSSSVDFRVRSHANGFIFQRDNIHPSNDVLNQATAAFKHSGLDFGAVDVIWNEHSQKAFVLEINTAPGLEGQTLEDYATAFRKAL